jgi:hypothetical protein
LKIQHIKKSGITTGVLSLLISEIEDIEIISYECVYFKSYISNLTFDFKEMTLRSYYLSYLFKFCFLGKESKRIKTYLWRSALCLYDFFLLYDFWQIMKA